MKHRIHLKGLFAAILFLPSVPLFGQGGPGQGGPPQLLITGVEVNFTFDAALCAEPFNGGLVGISGENLASPTGDSGDITVSLFRPLDPTPGEDLLPVAVFNPSLNPPLVVCLPTDIETRPGDFLLRVSVGTATQDSDTALISIDSDTDPLNELIESVGVNGTTVEIREAPGAVHFVDLAGVISDADIALQNDLDSEKAARIAADAAEEAARIAADATLQNNLDQEVSGRIAADAAEKAARIAADATLQNNLDQEVSGRIAADAAEEAARIAADATLQTDLVNEVSNRGAADNLLQSNLDSEEAARIADDDALQAQLNSPPVNPMQVALLRWYEASEAGNDFAVGDGPIGVAFDGANIWVANAFGDTLSKR